MQEKSQNSLKILRFFGRWSLVVGLHSDNPSLSGARDVRPENIFCSDTDYATAELIGNKLILHMAQAQGISRATALRWNDEWQNHGFIQKIKYGVYKKIA